MATPPASAPGRAGTHLCAAFNWCWLRMLLWATQGGSARPALFVKPLCCSFQGLGRGSVLLSQLCPVTWGLALLPSGQLLNSRHAEAIIVVTPRWSRGPLQCCLGQGAPLQCCLAPSSWSQYVGQGGLFSAASALQEDVREHLTRRRRQVLRGVHIAFSCVMPIQDPRPEGHELWQLALQVRLLHWLGPCDAVASACCQSPMRMT